MIINSNKCPLWVGNSQSNLRYAKNATDWLPSAQTDLQQTGSLDFVERQRCEISVQRIIKAI